MFTHFLLIFQIVASKLGTKLRPKDLPSLYPFIAFSNFSDFIAKKHSFFARKHIFFIFIPFVAFEEVQEVV